MRVLILLFTLSGCSTMTLRTGMVVIGGHPAFQASIEVGPSIMRSRHGISATSEYGMQYGERGAKGVTAVNVDVFDLDPDLGPVMRGGVRVRSSYAKQERDATNSFELRGGVYTGIGREQKTRSGGLGIEIAGGVATMRTTTPIYEANVVMHGHWNID